MDAYYKKLGMAIENLKFQRNFSGLLNHFWLKTTKYCYE